MPKNSLLRSAQILLLAFTGIALSACGLTGASAKSTVDEDKTINMIVTESPPFQEPTEIVKKKLAKKGWTLKTTYVTDIILPNNAVQNGEYDVNFFQHQAYLRQFNQDYDTSIEPVFSSYYGQSGLFSTKVDSLDELREGARVALPADTSNNGRALALLAQEGLIEVDESVDPTQLSQKDVTKNPKKIKFVEVDQQSLSKTLPDVDAGFVFVRQIAEAGLDYDDTVLALEKDPDIVSSFTAVIGANPDFRDTKAAKVLQEAYQSDEVEEWFKNYHHGVVTYIDDITVDNSAQKWKDYTSETEDARSDQ